MAKLTQKQVRELERAAGHLAAALDFIAKPDVVLARRRAQATTTLDYVRADGAVLTEMDKEIGSDFAMASTALSEILNFLAVQRGI
jgi:hypothetical protein